MVKEKEIGSFVFRNEGNGNLSGEFINKLSEHPFQEMCHLNTLPKINHSQVNILHRGMKK